MAIGDIPNYPNTPRDSEGNAVYGPRDWVIPALVATDAAVATTILAAGTAVTDLIVINETNEPLRVRFDGSAATSVRGILLAQGEGIQWQGNVPSGVISGYSTNTCNVFVAYR
jgi:hypothetical protein